MFRLILAIFILVPAIEITMLIMLRASSRGLDDLPVNHSERLLRCLLC